MINRQIKFCSSLKCVVIQCSDNQTYSSGKKRLIVSYSKRPGMTAFRGNSSEMIRATKIIGNVMAHWLMPINYLLGAMAHRKTTNNVTVVRRVEAIFSGQDVLHKLRTSQERNRMDTQIPSVTFESQRGSERDHAAVQSAERYCTSMTVPPTSSCPKTIKITPDIDR